MKRTLIAGLMLAAAPLAFAPAAQAQSSRMSSQQAMPVMQLTTPQYVAMAAKGGTFLEEASRIAYEKSQNAQVRRFARSEVVEQVRVAEVLGANADFATASTGAPAGGVLGSPVGSTVGGAVLGGLVGGPVGAAVGAGIGATSGGLSASGSSSSAPMMTSDAQKAQMLAQLQSLPAGPEFDALYVQSQIMGHQEAFAVHGGYAQTGDDPQLRRLASNTTRNIRLHLSQLSRIQNRI
jgi:predicted outer membrane protein